jgi:predicted MPP superfamily phosphohydrolase
MDATHIIFLICIVILVYGGLHYYLYRKLIQVVPTHKRAIVVTLSIFGGSLFVVEALIHNDVTPFITPIAWISFFWMGLVVLFFGISLPIDFLSWLARREKSFSIAQHFSDWIEKPLTSPLRTVVVALFVLLLGVNGVFNAQQINIQQVTLESEKLTRPIRLVQITDLHVGALTQKKHIQKIVKTINDLNADIIVSTGDLIDMSTDNSADLIFQLAALHSRLGKFAVYGNHETIAGLKKSRQLTELAGFTLLSNRGVTLDGVMNIFGVDDPSVAGRMQPGAHHPDEPTPNFSNSLFTVLLKHQPVIAHNATSTFDLQLSGHVHGGQIYPFGLLTRMVYRVPMGLSRISDKAWLYVSYGTGTWGPPMRVFAPPEITLFQLRPSNALKH